MLRLANLFNIVMIVAFASIKKFNDKTCEHVIFKRVVFILIDFLKTTFLKIYQVQREKCLAYRPDR